MVISINVMDVSPTDCLGNIVAEAINLGRIVRLDAQLDTPHALRCAFGVCVVVR